MSKLKIDDALQQAEQIQQEEEFRGGRAGAAEAIIAATMMVCSRLDTLNSLINSLVDAVHESK